MNHERNGNDYVEERYQTLVPTVCVRFEVPPEPWHIADALGPINYRSFLGREPVPDEVAEAQNRILHRFFHDIADAMEVDLEDEHQAERFLSGFQEDLELLHSPSGFKFVACRRGSIEFVAVPALFVVMLGIVFKEPIKSSYRRSELFSKMDAWLGSDCRVIWDLLKARIAVAFGGEVVIEERPDGTRNYVVTVKNRRSPYSGEMAGAPCELADEFNPTVIALTEHLLHMGLEEEEIERIKQRARDGQEIQRHGPR